MGIIQSSGQSYLGVDIGTSGIKIVELKREQRSARLVTYGFSELIDHDLKTDWQSDIRDVISVIKEIYTKSGMSAKQAVSALPTYSVFSSLITLSNISEKDLPSAINWEAKKVIPLPLEEMILDWVKIEDDESVSDGKAFKILLTGASRTLVEKYVSIFKGLGFQLLSLETETLSLIRALIGNDKSTVMLIEIGTNTTDISIIDKSIPVLNRSIDIGGSTITKSISTSLDIGINRAEQFKFDLGINAISSNNSIVLKTITQALTPIVNEIKYTQNLFQNKSSKKIEKVVLSGGGALLSDFTKYLSELLDMNIIIGDPWARVSHPVELEPLLKEIGPRLSVAIGLALREI